MVKSPNIFKVPDTDPDTVQAWVYSVCFGVDDFCDNLCQPFKTLAQSLDISSTFKLTSVSTGRDRKQIPKSNFGETYEWL